MPRSNLPVIAPSYFAGAVRDGFMGACPVIKCPFHECKGAIVPEPTWSLFVENSVVDRFRSLAASTVTFQCGSCHTRRSLLPGSDPGKKDSIP